MEMSGEIRGCGELSAVKIHADGRRENLGVLSAWQLPKRIIKALKRVLRALWRGMGLAAALLMLAQMAKAGHLPPYTMPLAVGLVTNAGVAYQATDMASGGVTPTISGFKYHDCGTGVGAEAVGNTALGTPWGGARVVGTPTNPTAPQYRSVATITFNAGFAITEWGLFSAAAVGTLWDRRVFAAVNVVNLDSIQFTYTLTINAGGT